MAAPRCLVNIYPYPLVNLSIVNSTSKTYTAIDSGSYYTVMVGEGDEITISADDYRSQTKTILSDTTITLIPNVLEISNLSNGTDTYVIRDDVAREAINNLATVATSGSYNDLSNKPTIPTVNNAILTIQKNGTNVATFTANASSNVTANISVPITTTSVTSGSTAALTSGGAYTNLVRRYSTSSATGSSTQGVYVNASGQIQPCTAVTSTYSSTGTAPVNGKAVASAISTKQNTLVSGTNIKTINGNSLLGSGDLTVGAIPDNSTISYDTNNALQTIAVKNVRDGSTLPIWHGTETQWNRGVAITWYYWQTSVTAMWTASTMPSSANWTSVTYGNGKFVAVAADSIKSAYSTDGINWTASTLPSSTSWTSVTYGNGKFVAVAGSGSNKAAYSTDGINWTASTLPSSASWTSVTYGDGKFVAVAYNSDKSAYSTDGINWTASTMPSSASWHSVAYGDGKFVTVTYDYNGNATKAAYSTDGINWIETTMPSRGSWCSVAYGDGKFVVTNRDSSKAAYSTDGINWIETTMPSYANWNPVTYGDGKFIAAASGSFSSDSDKSAIFTIQYDKCYTTDQNPTTTSVVYSAPEVTSSYTISSVTSGAITLSNNNTYYYNQSGNAFTYRTIGDAHPEYLAFIDGVGVKMGNTMIATNNSNNS